MSFQKQMSLDDLKQYIRRVPEVLERLQGVQAMVIGDIGLDEYLSGEVRRVSPEAPVPVLEVLEQDRRLGLTGNVAQNISSLGAEANLISVVGKDETAAYLREKLSQAEVQNVHLIDDPLRPTTRKVRVMAGPHHLLRVDFEYKQYISQTTQDQIFTKCQESVEAVDVVIIEDYAKGLLTPQLMSRLVELCKRAGKKILVDPHPTSPSSLYQGVDIMTPNRDEAVALSGLDYDELRDHPDLLLKVGEKLKQDIGLQQLVMTRGKAGMSLFFPNKEVVHLPTFAKQVFDVTGAGDTVIAALGLGLAAGEDLITACVFANLAAGVVVGKVGCVPCSKAELLEAHERALEELS